MPMSLLPLTSSCPVLLGTLELLPQQGMGGQVVQPWAGGGSVTGAPGGCCPAPCGRGQHCGHDLESWAPSLRVPPGFPGFRITGTTSTFPLILPTLYTPIQPSSDEQTCGSLWSPSVLGRGTFVEFSSVQSLSHVQCFATPWTAARQASLFITNSQSFLKLMSLESVMPSNHLILCHPLLLLPSFFPSIRVLKESVLSIMWPKYWSFDFNISPSMNIQDWFPLGLTGLISLQSKGLPRVFCNITV